MAVIGETGIRGRLFICELREEEGFILSQNDSDAELILSCDLCREESHCSGPRLYGYLKGRVEVEE